MKKLIENYKSKEKNLQNLEKKRADLLQEEVAFQAKRISARKLLHESEIDQISLLRRGWSTRKLDHALSKAENLQAGSRANICAPGSLEEDLAQFRAGIDAGLTEIYGEAAVKEMKENLLACSTSVKAIESHLAKLKDDIELIDVQIHNAKEEVEKAHMMAWDTVFNSIRDELQPLLPQIKRAWAAINGHNPYTLAWGDPRLFSALFSDDSKGELSSSERIRRKDELFQIREELHQEYFVNSKKH